MKAFLIICTCPAEHNMANMNCPVEKMMFIIHAHDMSKHVHDILEVQPVFNHKDVTE